VLSRVEVRAKSGKRLRSCGKHTLTQRGEKRRCAEMLSAMKCTRGEVRESDAAEEEGATLGASANGQRRTTTTIKACGDECDEAVKGSKNAD
jgi:hypothetical protein